MCGGVRLSRRGCGIPQLITRHREIGCASTRVDRSYGRGKIGWTTECRREPLPEKKSCPPESDPPPLSRCWGCRELEPAGLLWVWSRLRDPFREATGRLPL